MDEFLKEFFKQLLKYSSYYGIEIEWNTNKL